MKRARIPSSLAPHVARPATDAAELQRLRQAAFHLQGIVILPLAEIADARLRRRLIGEAERLYGARNGTPRADDGAAPGCARPGQRP